MPNDNNVSGRGAYVNKQGRTVGKKQLETVIIVTAIVLISAFLLIMFIGGLNGESFYSKEELLQIVNDKRQDSSCESVADALSAWKFPKFDAVELKYVELYYRLFYYDNIPSAAHLAKEVALDFLEVEYDFINVQNESEVTRALITCLIGAIGDDYGVYRTPDEQTEYTQSHTGTFAGIGIAILQSEDSEEYMITQVFEGSPAEKAGIKEGDLLYGASGFTVEKDGYDKVVNCIKGEIGTTVDVTVKRGDELLTFTAERASIEQITVSYEINADNIAYVRITSFKENTVTQFANAIDKIEEAGCVGIIFDLRSNGGGLLRSVVNMISYLVPDGTPISSFSTVSTLSKREPYYASHETSPCEKDEDHALSIPAVYICNKYTASAAELFCAALKDYGNMGILKTAGVGERTYGKGVMQSGSKLPTGSYVTLTTNLYNSPSGENYNGIGVIPNFTISDLDNTDPIPLAIEVLLGLTEQ